jgi:hypothetical protein
MPFSAKKILQKIGDNFFTYVMSGKFDHPRLVLSIGFRLRLSTGSINQNRVNFIEPWTVGSKIKELTCIHELIKVCHLLSRGLDANCYQTISGQLLLIFNPLLHVTHNSNSHEINQLIFKQQEAVLFSYITK